MAQTDPEDGFDQIMVQSWNSVAQQLRTLHNELSGDRARRRTRERAVQNERLRADQTAAAIHPPRTMGDGQQGTPSTRGSSPP